MAAVEPSNYFEAMVPQMRKLSGNLSDALCRPEGTFIFEYMSGQLFELGPHPRILDVVAGRHAFRLERDEEMRLSFSHGCPGAGTRIATVDLSKIAKAPGIIVYLTWSPSSISLSVGSVNRDSELLIGDGRKAAPKLIVGHTGEVFEIGDVGVEVGGFGVYEEGKLVVEPAAIETWRDTLNAVEVMRKAQSGEGFMFEVVQANAIVTMLVTGFEVYAQKRFRELVGEGISPDLTALEASFPKISSTAATEEAQILKREASILPFISRAGINFQNYEQCKKAYRAAYGLRLKADAGVSSSDIRNLKAAIRLRHGVVHVSPLTATRSAPDAQPLEFVNLEYADEAISLFERFINAFHVGSLALRPPESEDEKLT